MASKTINVDAELYLKMKEVKGAKSFTEFLKELMDKSFGPPMELFGVLRDEDDLLSYAEIKANRREKNVTL